MKIIKLIVSVMILIFIFGCQVPTEVAPASPEEQEVSDGLDDLDELDKLVEGLDEDITLNELDNLGLE
tara:strand:+ start:165 stop:368 length:204 start_codon:yes stop_codon:yes gene_type:complete